jgi:hypothetical protein
MVSRNSGGYRLDAEFRSAAVTSPNICQRDISGLLSLGTSISLTGFD